MTPMEVSVIPSILKTIKDAVAVARIRLLMQSRMRTWFFSVPASGFFLVSPFVLLGKTIVGERGERLKPFLALSGYDNYTGYLAVPLVFAFLTNSVYSWIGQAIRQEQQSGTLERTLISMRHPISLTLGGAVAHLIFLSFFIAVGIASLSLVADLRLHINWPMAIAVALAHLYAAYGLAFLLSSFFLWIRDAFIVQQVISFVIIPILSGAGFPIAIFPGWLQVMAWGIAEEVHTGTIERNFLAPVSRLIVLLGIGIYYIALYSFHVISLVVLAVVLMGDSLVITSSSLVTAGAAVLGLLFLSVGLGFAAAGFFLQARDQSLFLTVVHRPFMLLSGAVFLIDVLPAPLEFIARINPITYGIDTFRGALTGSQTLLSPNRELLVLYLGGVFALFAGILLFQWSIRRQLATGELARY